MTSNAAVVALTYGGQDIQDIDGIFLDLHRGGPGDIPSVRGTNWIVPSLDGETVGNRRVTNRRIELKGMVRGAGSDEAAQRADYWDNRIQLAGWFDPTAAADLVATLPGGLEYTISARTLPPFVFDQLVPSFATITVILESVDPEWELTGS